MANKVKWTPEALDSLKTTFTELLLSDRTSGQAVKELAETMSVSRVRIYQLLQKAGVQIKPRKNDSGIPASV